jgi:hypothetical protein
LPAARITETGNVGAIYRQEKDSVRNRAESGIYDEY